jgi:hypothetical protein
MEKIKEIIQCRRSTYSFTEWSSYPEKFQCYKCGETSRLIVKEMYNFKGEFEEYYICELCQKRNKLKQWKNLKKNS